MIIKFRRVLVIISDEEWDIKNLKNASGSKTTDEEVCNLIHQQGFEPYAIIVRPNRFEEQNNDFIEVCTF